MKRACEKFISVKVLILLTISIFLFSCQPKAVDSFEETKEGLLISTLDGTLAIYPVANNSVRVQFYEQEYDELTEFVLVEDYNVPEFDVTETKKTIRVSLDGLVVEVDRKTAGISYFDASGKLILSEKAGTRVLKADSVMGEPCYLVEQAFDSPANEAIFGLGQFQDGNYNLKGISRRLTQVNSQIVIPFIFSSEGYGLLWHQYGLTDFNPAGNFIDLKKEEGSDSGESKMEEVTTTAGTQKVAQNQTLYTGSFSVPDDGEYSIFLDLGDMGNRHYVVIDGKPVIDQQNMWLPPTAGKLVSLEKGEHSVQLVCKSDNNPSLAWEKKDNTTTFRSPNAKKLDYVVFAGEADEVITTYRNLTGNAPMLPKWAYGFWQCRERYTSADHLVETVKEFRKRDLPMDVIVQDWQYWGSRGWGVPQFDKANYPEPSKFIKEIHDMNAHFCISIWSNPDKNSELGRKYVENNRFIPGTKWLDYFNPKTQQEYWNTLKKNMFDHGVDAWWMDAVEPENDALKGETTHIGPGNFYRLVYPLLVSKSVYEGQREATSDKRVCILTRSAFSGQQRYGVINWSGDVGGTWDAYKRQIVAGLNFTITGLPYWTTDIGGFFRPGWSQYTDEKYHELLTRWHQWGAFNPIFRVHGYQSETEPWKYGETVEDNMRKMLNLRYRLLPYIYSEAWKVSNGSTMMRPLVMDFREDENAVGQAYEYMFGNAFLVAPITEQGVTNWDVYLPEAPAWYNFWTGERYKGGQTINTNAPLDIIPAYVRAGSIVPMGEIVEFSDEKPADELEIRIYRGEDGNFTLYEDESDNYNYEEGMFATIDFAWDEEKETLTISEQIGAYPGMIKERKFNIVVVGEGFGAGVNEVEQYAKTVDYKGVRLTVSL